MSMRWIARASKRIAAWQGALPQLWREPPPVLRESRDSLDLPVRPSRVLRRVMRVFLACVALHALELALLGHALPSFAAGGVAILFCWRGSSGRQGLVQPRRMLISKAGRIHLLTTRGELVHVSLCRASARFGDWMVLVLSDGRRCYRLVFGPDNLDPPQLAALRRRLSSLTSPPTVTSWPLPGPETKPPGSGPGG